MLLRYPVALALAFAVAHLHNTPWLSENWGTQDIYFFASGIEISSISGPRVYVSKSSSATSSSQESAQSSSAHTVRNKRVFALGLALLELSYGKPILSFQTADDLHAQEGELSVVKESIANRLVFEIGNRESPNYAKAVTRCITGEFNCSETSSFDNKEFWECFHKGVIGPLQADFVSL